MKLFHVLSVVLIGSLLLSGGCVSVHQANPVIKQNAATAFDRAKTSLLAEKKVAVDVLWVLSNIQQQQQDPAVGRFIQEMKGRIRNPHYLPGVFPDIKRDTLSKSVPSGLHGFFAYLNAPLGQPQETALRHLQQFIREDASGYILTHQLIVLLLAEQAGFPMSSEMQKSKRRLLKDIYREQMEMSTVDCLDLYMERVALLLFFGNKKEMDRSAVNAWIGTIVEMQLPDGSWPLSKSSLSYDGETTALSSPRSHTTVLAIMALQAYLDD